MNSRPRSGRNGVLPKFAFWGLLSFVFTFGVRGQTTNYVVDQFDTNTASQYINQNWGTAVPSITWSTNNAVTSVGPNNPGSGSTFWQITWPTTGDQIEVTRILNGGAVVNLSNFSVLSFDIMFASNSATDGNGSYGAVEVDCIPQGVGWPSTALAIYTSETNNGNGWIHVALPVNANLSITGIGLKIQQNRTGSNLTGTTKFWIDNIIFGGFTVPSVIGPPQILQLNTPQLWQRLEFQITNVPVASNPFDPDVIRLDATFTMPSGKSMIVPAFWYQDYQRTLSGNTEYDTVSGPPQWRLRFTPPEPGVCRLSLAIETNNVFDEIIATNFTVVSNALSAHFGYVSIPAGSRYFQTGNGSPLPLNGEDVAWWDVGTYDYDSWFGSMQSSGENFARIWMSPWCFGIEDSPGTLNNYALQPAWQLDYVLQLAEQEGIYVQLTLDDYREYASTAGADYWPSNPYDSTNGGPCATVNSFITNTVAQTVYQKRLRYLIGRYGYSQNLLAWEFFNEIDNDYSAVNGLPASQSLNPNNVATWHALMGNWMQTNDPYQHLITTSLTYASEHPEIWSLPQISYSSEHSYNETAPATSIASDSQYFLTTYAKPIMIGEFGTSWQSWEYEDNDPYYRGFREGIWGGALGGSVGTSMSWWWQNLDSAGLYYVYSSLGAILTNAGWGQGSWTNISFETGGPVSAIGLKGPQQALIYLVATNAAWPNGATNVSLLVQQGRTVTLTSWPKGTYYAQWYDPASATVLGISQGTVTNGNLSLGLPGFTVDLAGVVFPPPTLTSPAINQNGMLEFRLTSESGGIYTVEESDNLSTWTPLFAITNVTGTMEVTNPVSINGSALFFRAEQN